MAGRESQVEQTLRAQGITVSGLRVQDRGEVVSIYGSVANEADKTRAERVVEDTMKVKVANHLEATRAGTPSTTAAGGATGGAAATAASAAGLGHGYEVQQGDTLSKIAKRVYGDASEWKKIWEANKATIKNPDLIHPGQQIMLPPK